MNKLNESTVDPKKDNRPNLEDRPTAVEQLKKAAVSEDRPMGRKAPQAPFVLVGLSYFVALAVVVVIASLVILMMPH